MISTALNLLIDSVTTDERPRSAIVEALATGAGTDAETVRQILAGGIDMPKYEWVDAFAKVLAEMSGRDVEGVLAQINTAACRASAIRASQQFSVIRAAEAEGRLWDAVICVEGETQVIGENGLPYLFDWDALSADLSIFDGVPMYRTIQGGVPNHTPDGKHPPENLFGFSRNPRRGTDPKSGKRAVLGQVEIPDEIDGRPNTYGKTLRASWMERVRAGLPLPELSINGAGASEVVSWAGRLWNRLKRLLPLESIDQVWKAGAGGGLAAVRASAGEPTMKLVKALERYAPTILAKIDRAKASEAEIWQLASVAIVEGIDELKKGAKPEILDGLDALFKAAREHQAGRGDVADTLVSFLAAEPASLAGDQPKPEPKPAPAAGGEAPKLSDTEVRLAELEQKEALREVDLPEPMKEELRASWSRIQAASGKPVPASDIKGDIARAMKTVERIRGDGRVKDCGGTVASIQAGTDEVERRAIGLAKMMAPHLAKRHAAEWAGIPEATSIRRWAEGFTGNNFDGDENENAIQASNLSPAMQAFLRADRDTLKGVKVGKIFAAANLTTMALLVQNVLHLEVEAGYDATPKLGLDRLCRRMKGVVDYKPYRIIRVGSYGRLSSYDSESQDKPTLSTPSNVEGYATAAEYAGIETLTKKMVKNDLTDHVAGMGQRLIDAGVETVEGGVWDTFFGWDGSAINAATTTTTGRVPFNSTDANTSTTAFSRDAVKAMWTAMLKQVEEGSNRTGVISPKFVWVPPDLLPSAIETIKSAGFADSANRGDNSLQFLEVLPCNYGRGDTNNWYASSERPPLVVGFVDNMDKPRVTIADIPNAGEMFKNGKLQFAVEIDFFVHYENVKRAYGAIVT